MRDAWVYRRANDTRAALVTGIPTVWGVPGVRVQREVVLVDETLPPFHQLSLVGLGSSLVKRRRRRTVGLTPSRATTQMKTTFLCLCKTSTLASLSVVATRNERRGIWTANSSNNHHPPSLVKVMIDTPQKPHKPPPSNPLDLAMARWEGAPSHHCQQPLRHDSRPSVLQRRSLAHQAFR